MTVKVMKGWFVCGRAGPFPVCASLRAGEMYDQAETQALPLVAVDEGLVLEAARARRLRRAVSTVCRDRPCLRRRPREPTRAWPSMAGIAMALGGFRTTRHRKLLAKRPRRARPRRVNDKGMNSDAWPPEGHRGVNDSCGSYASKDLLDFVGKRKFATVLADPPWRFVNRTGKMAPEHRRLSRYGR
jgi:hypothetical protein